jgi:hypothetical protein
MDGNAHNGKHAASDQKGCRHMGGRINSRPDLCALLRDDGEAYLLLAQLDPRERPKRVEGRCELYTPLVIFLLMRSGDELLVNVETFCI